MFSDDLARRVWDEGVVAVLVLDQTDDAVPVARALRDGGVNAIELTLRTPVALEALRRIRAEVPEMLVGAGTILSPGQVSEALEAGAAFGVAPGMNPRVVEEAARCGLPFAPGVCTPTDIELAVEAGCRTLKFFPCEPSGGLPYLRTVAAPFAHLGVRFIPLGGVGMGNAESYLREPSVLALGGSWLAPKAMVEARALGEISAAAAAARGLVTAVRGEITM